MGIQRATPKLQKADKFELQRVFDNAYAYIYQLADALNVVQNRAGGITTLPAGALLNGPHSQRITTPLYPATVNGLAYFETDRRVLYVVGQVVTTGPQQLEWMYAGGVDVRALADRPADLGLYDTGFPFFDTGAGILYIWDGANWVMIIGGGGSSASYIGEYTLVAASTMITSPVPTPNGGDRLTLKIVQDATGGREITYDVEFSTLAALQVDINFTANATTLINLVAMSDNLWYPASDMWIENI